MQEDRFIVHVDMDAFFASVEQRDNPLYRARPVIVGSDPKHGKGRGVVSTCSYEARQFGVHSAMPISIAYRKCPQAVFLPVDFDKYSQVSAQIIDILNSFSPIVEQVSIDEAFIDISDTYKLHSCPYGSCVAMKQAIRNQTGLTASVGLAPTKMVAKIASGLRKPDGLVEVRPDAVLEFLWPLDVGLLWGIGEKTKALLNDAGIYKIGELAKRSKQELAGMFGKNGIWFWQISHGIDDSQVIAEHETKSISNETTFEKDTTDRKRIEKELAWLCELVSSRLREEGFKGRTVTLKIRFSGFQTFTRSLTLSGATNFSEELIRISRDLLAHFDVKAKPVRLVGVRVSNLSDCDERFLFKDRDKDKKEEIHKAVDEIRRKFGKSCIVHATAFKQEKGKNHEI